MQSQRISIHAGNRDESYSPHPKWKDENDAELSSCPFAESEEFAERELHEMNAMLEKFLDRAPSDANAEVHVERTEDGFDARIDVYSSQRTFGPVHGAGSRFREVVESLVCELKEEIDEWKRQRSLNVGDGL